MAQFLSLVDQRLLIGRDGLDNRAVPRFLFVDRVLRIIAIDHGDVYTVPVMQSRSRKDGKSRFTYAPFLGGEGDE